MGKTLLQMQRGAAYHIVAGNQTPWTCRRAPNFHWSETCKITRRLQWNLLDYMTPRRHTRNTRIDMTICIHAIFHLLVWDGGIEIDWQLRDMKIIYVNAMHPYFEVHYISYTRPLHCLRRENAALQASLFNFNNLGEEFGLISYKRYRLITDDLLCDIYCIPNARTSKRQESYYIAGHQTMSECHRAIKFVHPYCMETCKFVRPSKAKWIASLSVYLRAKGRPTPGVAAHVFPGTTFFVDSICANFVFVQRKEHCEVSQCGGIVLTFQWFLSYPHRIYLCCKNMPSTQILAIVSPSFLVSAMASYVCGFPRSWKKRLNGLEARGHPLVGRSQWKRQERQFSGFIWMEGKGIFHPFSLQPAWKQKVRGRVGVSALDEFRN